MKRQYLVYGMLGIIAFAVWQLRSSPRSSHDGVSFNGALATVQQDTDHQDYYLSTESETRVRVDSLMRPKGTEDVSNLLKEPDSSGSHSVPVQETRDYLPVEQTEWIVHADFEIPVIMQKAALDSIFTREWKEKYKEVTIYGYSPSEKRWTFVFAGGSPNDYSRLQVAWEYYASWDSDARELDAESCRVRLEALRQALSGFGRVRLRPRLEPERAEQHAAKIKDMVSRRDYSCTLVLKTDAGTLYDGKEIWDVMMCLGLEWGHMDLFHWRNRNNYGHSNYFSVGTNTTPGYFLPELIVADEVHTQDLIFSFSIPRTYKPLAIFASMQRAIEYAQKRLGGSIIDENGAPVNYDKMKKSIETIERELTELGFTPGLDAALRQF